MYSSKALHHNYMLAVISYYLADIKNTPGAVPPGMFRDVHATHCISPEMIITKRKNNINYYTLQVHFDHHGEDKQNAGDSNHQDHLPRPDLVLFPALVVTDSIAFS